jgi:predicted MPP superfamily phosphohydrolase
MSKDLAAQLVALKPESSARSIAKELMDLYPGSFRTEEGARSAVRKARKSLHLKDNTAIPFISDKKVGNLSWREMNAFATEARRIKSQGSWSQDKANLIFPEKTLGIIMLSDLHALSYGTDHGNLERIIDEILAVDGLMIGLVGDLIQMSIKLRSVQEVSDNILPPDIQMLWLESFLDEIKERVVFCTWDNHAVEREEKQTGVSLFKWLASRRVVYFNGIGHIDLTVGNQLYKLAVTHKVRGRSMLNPVHGQQRYMRFEGIDREIMIAGDSHTPGTGHYTDGEKTRLAINCGAAQIMSGYTQRYFSLYTHPIFPILTLRPDRHSFTADWTLADWKERNI